MTLKTTLDGLGTLQRIIDGASMESRSPLTAGELCHDAKVAHELLRLCKMFIPTPEGISGYDDPNAPELVKKTLVEAGKFWQALEESK